MEAYMIHRSPYPDVTIPDTALAPFLLQHAGRLAEKPALIEGETGRTFTYAQLADATRRVAAGLARRGIQKGDVLAFYCPNGPEYIITLLALWTLGAVPTTINPLFTARELAYQLKDARASSLLTAPDLLDKASEAARDAGIRTIFLLGSDAAAGAIPFAALLAEDAAPPDVAIAPRRDLAALLYSSGTTGLPKGVMLTHANIVANISQLHAITHVAEDETLMVALPFFHIAAWVIFLHMGLTRGATIVTMARFDLARFLQLSQDHHVTRTLLVPPLVLALAKQPRVDDYRLSYRVIETGAAPLAESVARTCETRLGCAIQQLYGLTETSPITHGNTEAPGKPDVISVGHCVPNTECKVIDPASGAALGPNQQGELLVRGPQIMLGYLNNPEATTRAIEPDGWFHTGDIGYADESGAFFIVDRVKELIKYKGYQVAPAELEALLLAHPAIADAAVIPSPDEEAGEVPKAFVVLKAAPAPEDASPDSLMAYVAARVAPHKKIRRLEFTDQIPKTASGKILRRILVERERAAVSAPERPTVNP
jgi:acyl-CoA synthetase (AMP-forming)/AMP-acid ligase II